MKTYQDFLKVGERDSDKMDFVREVINDHKASELYRTAVTADQYDRHKNVTITNFQKLLYTVSGKAVVDNFSANFKMASRFFNRFVTQQNQFLLGNSIVWENDETGGKLGEDFNRRLKEAGKAALIGGVAFGFWNFDRLVVFDVTEFAPLYDEENGALRAGVRWWQVAEDKPMRATLYEEDGYTDYIWKDGKAEVLQEKRTYIENVTYSAVDGTEIFDGQNYPSFPIVPFWGNPVHQSELVGIREQIDCYDLIKSGFANNVDDASMIYWTIQNAGGMDDIDLAEFVEHMKTVKAAVVSDTGARAESHTVEAPYASREALLDRLRKDLYEDYMALDVQNIAGGAVTATQIKAAYEPMNEKADQYEDCVREFIQGILRLAGIEDRPTFTRSILVNAQEEVMTVVSAAPFLSEDYVTRKIITLLGDGDKADEVLNEITSDAYNLDFGEDEEGEA